MEHKEEYNGYTNKETWGVALIIDNDQGLKEEALNIVRENKNNSNEFGSTAIIDVEDGLKDFVESFVLRDNDNLFKSELLQDALNRVNFRELAENYLKEVEDEKAECSFCGKNFDKEDLRMQEDLSLACDNCDEDDETDEDEEPKQNN